jgi:predicted Zn-dependent protease
MEAATGQAGASIGGTPVTVRLVAIRQSAKTVYRFIYAAAPEDFDAMDARFLTSARSFREIDASAAVRYAPKRIEVITVQAGDTVAALAERMQVDAAKAEWFCVLNHLAANATLQAGQKVKIVVEGNPQVSALPGAETAPQLASVR